MLLVRAVFGAVKGGGERRRGALRLVRFDSLGVAGQGQGVWETRCPAGSLAVLSRRIKLAESPSLPCPALPGLASPGPGPQSGGPRVPRRLLPPLVVAGKGCLDSPPGSGPPRLDWLLPCRSQLKSMGSATRHYTRTETEHCHPSCDTFNTLKKTCDDIQNVIPTNHCSSDAMIYFFCITAFLP